MEKRITVETANLILDALAFHSILSMKRCGVPTEDIVDMTDEIMENARNIFIEFCEKENITEVIEEINIMEED